MYIHKFRSFDSEGFWLEILRDNNIYFPSPTALNDPFDSTLPIRFLDADSNAVECYLRKTAERHRVWRKSQVEGMTDEEFDREIEEKLRIRLAYLDLPRAKRNIIERAHAIEVSEPYGVFSASLSGQGQLDILQNHLMWSHYGDNHRGFCFRINFKKLDDFWRIRNHSNFADDIQHISPFIVRYDALPLISPYDNDDLEISDAQLEQLLATKSPSWSYEQEYRLISLNTGKTRKLLLQDGIIDEVYLGLNTSDECREVVIKIARSKGEILKVYQAVPTDGSFMLAFDRLL